jgi:uncharacterized Zn-binding protein involved in type VI secretion
MRRALALFAAAALAVCGCKPSGGGSLIGGNGLPTSQLDNQIAAAIGDPTTCVLVADAASGKVLYRYGDDFNCVRGLPACDAPGLISAKTALPFAARPGGRFASCNSLPDGSRTVGWAEGPVQSNTRKLVYSAVMEGQRTLPGREMNARLYDAFQKAGL